MTEVKLQLTADAARELRELQALLGHTDCRETLLYLFTLGRAIVRLTAQGCDILVIQEDTGLYGHIEEPSLDNIRNILKEEE